MSIGCNNVRMCRHLWVLLWRLVSHGACHDDMHSAPFAHWKGQNSTCSSVNGDMPDLIYDTNTSRRSCNAVLALMIVAPCMMKSIKSHSPGTVLHGFHILLSMTAKFVIFENTTTLCNNVLLYYSTVKRDINNMFPNITGLVLISPLRVEIARSRVVEMSMNNQQKKKPTRQKAISTIGKPA